MKKKLIFLTAAIIIVALAIISFTTNKTGLDQEITVTITKSPFEVTVVNGGDLEAKNSIPILGPEGLVAARVWSVKIEDIVEEGTIVKKGDYVATLDRTEIGERIRNEELDGEESLNNLERTQIDTALDLRGRRDELKKKLLAIERKKLQLKNSQYEPPATIQQAELDLKEAEMDYQLALEDYNLREEKAISMVKRRQIEVEDDRMDLKLLTDLYEKFVIYAPENGMVIYHKDRGNKLKKGSSVSARNPIVATLPDLSKMKSICYVNEVDIRMIKVGQQVRVGIDAFPSKRLTGVIRKIANVGEALPARDAKVFEVEVEINEMDMDIKPGMTTSNEIIIRQDTDMLSLPLECLHSLGDSLSFVYLKKGLHTVKKEVVVGQANSNQIIIKSGLQEGDRVLLSLPKTLEDLPFENAS
jgi:multidrug efflux pump subunit AcrA (membrane-fusion protein)